MREVLLYKITIEHVSNLPIGYYNCTQLRAFLVSTYSEWRVLKWKNSYQLALF